MNTEGNKTLCVLFLVIVLLVLAGVLVRTDTSLQRDQSLEAQTATNKFNTDSVTQTTTTERYKITTEIPKAELVAAQSAREYVQDRVSDFRDAVSRSPTSSVPAKSTFRNSLDVYKTKEYISYAVRIDQYTGGANANQFVQTFVQQKDHNQLVDISEVIGSDRTNKFLRLLKSKLEKTAGISSNSVADLRVSDLSNFYVSSREVTVLFPPYTIAPGAAGVVSVTVDR
jgi:hypothetical protein